MSTVTDLTKVIDGVRAVVLWDQDINAGQLEESELAFQAQDHGGNVWLLGEYPEVYEDGGFKGAPDTWISGLDGATPGVLMRAHPRAGTFSYLQGLAPKTVPIARRGGWRRAWPAATAAFRPSGRAGPPPRPGAAR